jgi:hypothetical protein
MDAAAWTLFAGLALCATGLAGLWRLRTAPRGGRSPNAAAAPRPMRPPAKDADRLLAPYQGRLRAIQERSRFSAQSFERDVLALLRRLLAAPHGGEAAQAGPDIGQALALAHGALGLRQAVLLPPGAQAEDIEPRSFRWTYGVLLAALLHELRSSAAWSQAATGELRSTLQPWLEPQTLQWLLEDEQLVQQLQAFFAAPTGRTVFHELIGQALAALAREPAPVPAAPAPAAAREPRRPAHEVHETPHDAPHEEPPPADDAPPPAAVAPPTPLPTAFMDWLATGIATQSIPTHGPEAAVHFVTDGMVLAVPAVFQHYAAAQAAQDRAAPLDITALGKDVQKAVVAEGWHLRGPQNAHLHRFVRSGGGPAVFRGLLIPSPQRFLAAVPAPDPALSRLM